VQAGQAASRDSSVGWRNNKNINWKITRLASPKKRSRFPVILIVRFLERFVQMTLDKWQQIRKKGKTRFIWQNIVLSRAIVIAVLYSLLVDLSEPSINFSTLWTGSKACNWGDLESVKFNILCCWYVLQFKDGNTIRISSYLGGNGYLLDFLREKGHDF
jgi:hypothetical protein